MAGERQVRVGTSQHLECGKIERLRLLCSRFGFIQTIEGHVTTDEIAVEKPTWIELQGFLGSSEGLVLIAKNAVDIREPAVRSDIEGVKGTV